MCARRIDVPLADASPTAAWAALAAVAGMALAAVGCSSQKAEVADAATSGSRATGSCMVLDPDASACVSPSPSFARDIAPLLNRDCNTCHVAGSGLWPLTGYRNVRDWAYAIFVTVEGCTMPPADAGAPISDADRAVLLDWIACGANDN